MQETWVQPLGWEDPLTKERATHSNTLVWKISWTEEPGRLQYMGTAELDMTEQLSMSTCVLKLERLSECLHTSGLVQFPFHFSCQFPG